MLRPNSIQGPSAILRVPLVVYIDSCCDLPRGGTIVGQWDHWGRVIGQLE
jgi:hypothetical protein